MSYVSRRSVHREKKSFCEVVAFQILISRTYLKIISQLVLWAQSNTKDYIRAENKLQSISQIFIPQVIIPYVSFFSNRSSNCIHNFGTPPQEHSNKCFRGYLYSAGTQHGNQHQLSVTWAGWPILFCGPTHELVLATANAATRERILEKMQVNGPEG